MTNKEIYCIMVSAQQYRVQIRLSNHSEKLPFQNEQKEDWKRPTIETICFKNKTESFWRKQETFICAIYKTGRNEKKVPKKFPNFLSIIAKTAAPETPANGIRHTHAVHHSSSHPAESPAKTTATNRIGHAHTIHDTATAAKSSQSTAESSHSTAEAAQSTAESAESTATDRIRHAHTIENSTPTHSHRTTEATAKPTQTSESPAKTAKLSPAPAPSFAEFPWALLGDVDFFRGNGVVTDIVDDGVVEGRQGDGDDVGVLGGVGRDILELDGRGRGRRYCEINPKKETTIKHFPHYIQSIKQQQRNKKGKRRLNFSKYATEHNSIVQFHKNDFKKEKKVNREKMNKKHSVLYSYFCLNVNSIPRKKTFYCKKSFLFYNFSCVDFSFMLK